MKTVIGAFNDSTTAERAMQDLVSQGIARDDISLVANNEGGRYAPVAETSNGNGSAIATDAVVGAEVGAGVGLLIGLTGLAIPGLGWIAGAGWLMATLMGAATGAVVGGLVGALTSVGVPEEDAVRYSTAVQQGSLLLAVRASDADASRVASILDRDGAINVDEKLGDYRTGTFNHVPGIQTGGHAVDGTPDTRGVTEKVEDAVTGDRYDDKTGKRVA